MKKNIFVALAAAFMLLFSSCNKDIDLVGTQWKANYTNTISYEGMSMNMSMDFVLNFVDATNYTMTGSGSFTMMGYTETQDPETSNGTYTFDGENGVFDGEQAFSYNKKDKTIVVKTKIDEEETAAMMGSDEIVLTFNQVK